VVPRWVGSGEGLDRLHDSPDSTWGIGPWRQLGRWSNGAAGVEAGALLDGKGDTQVDPYGGAAAAHVLIRVDGFWPQKFQGPRLTSPVHRAASGSAAGQATRSATWVLQRSQEGSMNDTSTEKPEDQTFRLSVGDPRSCQAIFTKVTDGYTVTVSLKENGRTRALAQSTVDSFTDAEAVS
jgi:hypothetical protein